MSRWRRMRVLVIEPILQHVRGVRKRFKGKTKYRGLEHYWYTPWDYALLELCEGTETLGHSPQRYVSSSVHNEDETKIKRWLIPDFTISRYAERKVHHATASDQLALPQKQAPRRSPRIQLKLQAQRQNEGCGRAPTQFQGHSYRPDIRVLKKIVILVEIKPLPDESSPERIIKALNNARTNLKDQVNLFFSKDNWRSEKEKAVGGMWAAGMYWNWEIFTPGNLGAKPLSKNIDSTWKPFSDSDSEQSEDIDPSEQCPDAFDIGPIREDSSQGNDRGEDGSEGDDDCNDEDSDVDEGESEEEDGEDESGEEDELEEGDKEDKVSEDEGGEGKAKGDEESECSEDGHSEASLEAGRKRALYFILDTEASDNEMEIMLDAIFKLPGSKEFDER